VTDLVVKGLRAIARPANVLANAVELQTYEYDACLERHLPRAVVFVDSTEQVAAVVRLLAANGVPFVARGSGTNLSGGALALEDGVVIEMGRMNRILEIDIPNQCVTVQPGIYNLDISTALAPLGYYYAPDPASQKACSLGGNVGENAGGPHCFKYGVTSNHVLGLEVVLSDGEVVRLGGKNVETPGLDLTGVFVGSEGTLGIVTAAVLRILPKPEAVKTMLGVCESLEDGGNVVSAVVAAGLVPATLEMMDNLTIRAIEDSMACGFPREAAAVLLIELDGLVDGMDEMAEQIVAICRDNGVADIRVARDEAERAALWRGRKGAFGAISRLAPNYLVADGTVPRTRLPEALRRVAQIACAHDLQVASVFHAGDGNLHPLLLFDSRNADETKRVMAAGMDILRACVELGGTVSGEHGIGVEKIDAMHLVFDDAGLRAQGFVKEAFDPWHLSNPGKVLPGRDEGCDSRRDQPCDPTRDGAAMPLRETGAVA
jgi:glycolate oxidase